MRRRRAGFSIAAAALLAAVALTGHPPAPAIASPATTSAASPLGPPAPPGADARSLQAALAVAAASLAVDADQPFERRVSGFARDVARQIRWIYRMLRWMFWRAIDWWGRWAKRVGFSLGVAIVAALADGGLVNAWRVEGLRTLATYSALMLYVYGRLLFSSGVNLAPKLLLVGALIYGVIRRDFIPDKSIVPGSLEDIALIVIATRAFVYACPEELINEYAERAVNLKRRMLSLQKAPPR